MQSPLSIWHRSSRFSSQSLPYPLNISHMTNSSKIGFFLSAFSTLHHFGFQSMLFLSVLNCGVRHSCAWFRLDGYFFGDVHDRIFDKYFGLIFFGYLYIAFGFFLLRSPNTLQFLFGISSVSDAPFLLRIIPFGISHLFEPQHFSDISSVISHFSEPGLLRYFLPGFRSPDALWILLSGFLVLESRLSSNNLFWDFFSCEAPTFF